MKTENMESGASTYIARKRGGPVPKPVDCVPGESRDAAGNNCNILQDGSSEADHAHVSVSTPMMLKKREYQNDPRYITKQEADIVDRKRERNNTRLRSRGDVRPLGGNK